MNDQDYLKSSSDIPEMVDHSFENNLQEELDEMLNFESEPDDDDDGLVIDDDLFENDLDTMEQDVEFSDANIAPLFKYRGRNVLWLTYEEEEVIRKCTDPPLQRCLIQNRLKMVQLKELHDRLLKIQNNCSDDINRERQQLSESNENRAVPVAPKTFIWKLGMPYFKDHFCYGAPPNIDSLNKLQNNEYIITQFSEGRRWVDDHQMILRNGIETSYYKHYESQLELQMRNIERQIKKVDDELGKKQGLQNECDRVQAELEALQKGKPQKTPPYGSEVGIDWLLIASNDLKGQHSINECKAMWKIYLHPHISKKDWTTEENEKIKKLAKKYCYQDWDSLAENLGTNRSGYLVCVHYYTKLCDKFRRERFLPSEDKYLMEIVENCRLGDYIPWASVASFFEDRSKHQLYHRYRYYLSRKDEIKKGIFTEAEDILLAHIVQHFGKEFSKLAEFIPHRTSIQLRNRYSNYLEKLTINLGNYTHLDDQKILDYVKAHGDKKWTGLAKELKRTRSHVRQRYLTVTKWLKKNPNLKLEEIPRRKQTFLSLCHLERQTRMTDILKKLEDSKEVPTLETVEALLKRHEGKSTTILNHWRVATKKSSFSSMDYKIIEFLQGTCKLQRESRMLDDTLLSESAQRITKILELLGADNRHIVENAKVKNPNDILMDREHEILEIFKKASNISTQMDDSAVPSTSKADPRSVEMPQNQVQFLLPPNLHNMLLLRGCLVKFEVYKETTNESFISNVRLHSTKTALEDPMVWRREQNLRQMDDCTRDAVIKQRNLFEKRLFALIKWPSILSILPIEHCKGCQIFELESDGIDLTNESSKVGRPPRKMYPKVLKMLEAKKRKLAETNASKNCDFDSNMDSPENPKRQKIPRPRKAKPEHAVRYLPRRAKAKGGQTNQEVVEECLNDSGGISTEQSTSTDESSSQRIVNIADLKLPASNVPLVDRNVLLKLGQANGSNRIVILGKRPEIIVDKQVLNRNNDSAPSKKYSNRTIRADRSLPQLETEENQIHKQEQQNASCRKLPSTEQQHVNRKLKVNEMLKDTNRTYEVHLPDHEVNRLIELDIMKQEVEGELDLEAGFEEDLEFGYQPKEEPGRPEQCVTKSETFADEVRLEFFEDSTFEEDSQEEELQYNCSNSASHRGQLEMEAGHSQSQLSREIRQSWTRISNKRDQVD